MNAALFVDSTLDQKRIRGHRHQTDGESDSSLRSTSSATRCKVEIESVSMLRLLGAQGRLCCLL
eukprot:1267385-Amphidinium_carterae.1